jgi:hypothetical protein
MLILLIVVLLLVFGVGGYYGYAAGVTEEVPESGWAPCY